MSPGQSATFPSTSGEQMFTTVVPVGVQPGQTFVVASASRRTAPMQHASLVGRLVSVPETEWVTVEAGGDPSFCYAGAVAEQQTGHVLIQFAYTGEKEWFPTAKAVAWLQPDVTPLCDSFARL